MTAKALPTEHVKAGLCRPGRELDGFSWMPALRAANLNLELWSRLALALL